MIITIEPELATSVDYFFAYPYKKFKNQKLDTNLLKIPLQQREYEWGANTEHILGLLEDLDYHLDYGDKYYFAGTVLLENQEDSFLKIIDGQQRITTLYLFNFLAFIISRYRLEYIPANPSQVLYALEFNKRFELFSNYEKKIFISHLSHNVQDLIRQDGETDSNTNLLERLGRTSNAESKYWKKIQPRLQFEDTGINEKFIKTIKSATLELSNGEICLNKSKGLYSDALHAIFDYLNEKYPRNGTKIDIYLDNILEKINKYILVCGLASIISENSDDSFRLFEILNDRGQDLSALDLIKNIILEKCHRNNITINEFNTNWKELKSNVRKSFSKGNSDSVFIENIIRSEGSNLKNKEISYLNNKLVNDRPAYYRKIEQIDSFFQRLMISSQLLREVNENTSLNQSNNSSPYNRAPMSCFQYTTFMKMINYNWGPQIVLASNINYLANSDYKEGLNLGASPDWKNSTSSASPMNLNHFSRFLGDIVLKTGLMGIVNGIATKELPSVSRTIVQHIINNLENNPTDYYSSPNLHKLKTKIVDFLNTALFTQQNIDLFETHLSDTFVASTGQKKNIIKILLYFIYSKGGVNYKMLFPELEHLESSRPIQGTNPYYVGPDREELINRFGNFALIEKDININDFSNKPLVEKIKIIRSDPKLSALPLFQNDIFQNLDFDKQKQTSGVYGNMPLIKKSNTSNASADDSFDVNGVPTKYFFQIRSNFLAKLARNVVCNTKSFLDHSSNY